MSLNSDWMRGWGFLSCYTTPTRAQIEKAIDNVGWDHFKSVVGEFFDEYPATEDGDLYEYDRPLEAQHYGILLTQYLWEDGSVNYADNDSNMINLNFYDSEHTDEPLRHVIHGVGSDGYIYWQDDENTSVVNFGNSDRITQIEALDTISGLLMHGNPEPDQLRRIISRTGVDTWAGSTIDNDWNTMVTQVKIGPDTS